MTRRSVTLPTAASEKCHRPRSVTAGDARNVSPGNKCHRTCHPTKPLSRRKKSCWVTLVTLLFLLQEKELRKGKGRGGGVGGIEGLGKIGKSSVMRHPVAAAVGMSAARRRSRWRSGCSHARWEYGADHPVAFSGRSASSRTRRPKHCVAGSFRGLPMVRVTRVRSIGVGPGFYKGATTT